MRTIGMRALVMVAVFFLAAAARPAEECGEGLYVQDGVYRIETFEALRALSEEIEAGGTAFAGEVWLMADIAAAEPIRPIGGVQAMFLGTFDGRGHTISGLSIEGEGEFQGLFGYVGTGGIVRNLTLEGISVRGTRYVGGVAGYCAGRIEQCAVIGGRITADSGGRWGTAAGGVAGLSCGTVSRCASLDVAVSGVRCVGGIVGSQCSNVLEGCVSTAAVVSRDSGQAQAGGIVGGVQTGGTVRGCISAGRVFAPNASWTGGVAGALLSGRMTGCMSLAGVTGRECGAVAGYAARRAQVMLCRYRTTSAPGVGEGRQDGAVRMWKSDWRARTLAERAVREAVMRCRQTEI